MQEARSALRQILVATDGSAGSDRAIDAAAQLAKSLGARLLILTVQDRLSRDTVEAFETIEHVAEGDVAEITAQNVLFRARKRAARAGATDVHLQTESGDPTEAILKVSKQRNADAIVVGKRGRGSLAGLLLGSVSQKLVTLAPCNVMVVP